MIETICRHDEYMKERQDQTTLTHGGDKEETPWRHVGHMLETTAIKAQCRHDGDMMKSTLRHDRHNGYMKER